MATDSKASAAAELFAGAMPKGIGALEYLAEHPEYDGRGVIIAVLDTGVDPGAAGLQTTPDGRPKILDILDCTGSGDIDTSRLVTADADGWIEGHFGARLRVNPAWANPSGEWRVGYKRAFDLFAGGLRKRVAAERKRRLEEAQRPAVAAATRELAEAKAAIGSAKSVSEGQKRALDEKEARVKLLQELAEGHKDAGPLVHAVVWHDGSDWRAALDTSDMHAPGSGEGLLADHPPLADFGLERQYGTFSAEDACNYGVHVYDGGDLLSVVVECGSHGTHVAGIAAAYHPDEPHLNGIAPGAQIVSMKIGDSRLDGMETNTGLSRALVEVLRTKADLINLSYGEATATPDRGRFIELASEVVNEHGVVFVSSAGNAGPALSTVGAPGGTSSAIISVGAFVSPELAAAGHSVRSPLEQGQQYTWSSRGPAADGDFGVTISAPGGAIAPVPQWTQQSRQLMNGTSMASPCAAGGIALLLSGLKAEGRRVTPARVRRAVENTALPIDGGGDPAWQLTYGRGLLQVHKAFELLAQSEEADWPDVRFAVSAKRAGGEVKGRGIYLREPADAAQPSSHSVEVLPRLRQGVDTREECLRVEGRLRLVSSQPAWAACPELLLLPFNGRTFEVKVDPTGLPPGVHYAEIQALDSEREWRGPLFRVPITVVKPLEPTEIVPGTFDLGSPAFEPGTEARRFLAVPEGATWGELQLSAGAFDTPKTFMLRATQLLPHTRYSDSEMRQTAALAPAAEAVFAFPVVGGATLELTLAQFWSSLGPSSLAARVAFHGVEAPQSVCLDGAAGVAKLLVRAPFRREKLAPTAKLTHVRWSLRPAEAVLTPLRAPRDELPRARLVHSLLLTYRLKVEEPGPHRPRLPALDRYVYDGTLDAQLTFVFDSNKRLLGVGDCYPAETTLQKGEHTVRLLLRHDCPQHLERFRDLPLVVERKLKEPLQLGVFGSNSEALAGKPGVKELSLAPGERRALFLAPKEKEEKLPKDAAPGRLLTGKLQLGKLSELAGGKPAPAAVELLYVIPPKKESKEGPKVADPDDSSAQPPQRQLAEKLRDATVAFLEDSATNGDESPEAAQQLEEAAQKLLDEWQGAAGLPVLLWRLKRAEAAAAKQAAGGSSKEGAAPAPEASSAVLQAAEAVLAAVQRPSLAAFLAQKSPDEGPGLERRRKAADEQKGAVVAALLAIARVHTEAAFARAGAAGAGEQAAGEQAAAAAAAAGETEELQDAFAEQPAVAAAGEPEALEEAFAELRKWVDMSDEKHALLLAKREAAGGRLATAVRALHKAANPSERPPDKAALELQAQLLDRLGWGHWARAERSRLADAFPPDWRPF